VISLTRMKTVLFNTKRTNFDRFMDSTMGGFLCLVAVALVIFVFSKLDTPYVGEKSKTDGHIVIMDRDGIVQTNVDPAKVRYDNNWVQ
jgi:hypothetical protein